MSNNQKKKPISRVEKTVSENLQRELNSFKAQTDLGKRLLEISKKGLENGVGVLSADEITHELGRTPY